MTEEQINISDEAQAQESAPADGPVSELDELRARVAEALFERRRQVRENADLVAELQRSNTELEQFAGVVSHDLAAFLARSLRGVAVMVVAPYRSDEIHRRHPLRPLLSSWERMRSVDRIELSRFDRARATPSGTR